MLPAEHHAGNASCYNFPRAPSGALPGWIEFYEERQRKELEALARDNHIVRTVLELDQQAQSRGDAARCRLWMEAAIALTKYAKQMRIVAEQAMAAAPSPQYVVVTQEQLDRLNQAPKPPGL